MTRAHIKYYGTLAATLFVLLLSTNRIASALGVVEQRFINDNNIFFSAWMAAMGLQVFEVLAGIGIADILARKPKDRSSIVMLLLIFFLLTLFATNLAGNLLFTYANMAGKDGHILLMADLEKLDILKKYWVWWGSVPVPLMGVIGVTVQAIFSKDLPKKEKAKAPRDLGIKMDNGSKILIPRSSGGPIKSMIQPEPEQPIPEPPRQTFPIEGKPGETFLP